MEDQSSDATMSSNDSDNSDRALTISLLNRANLTDDITGTRAALGALTYGCIKYAAQLEKSTVRGYGPAVSKLLKDIPAWIRANPYKFMAILGGIPLVTLACATPAILGAVGFSAVGPVAGSMAAAWQASIGSVVAGSLFSFLQGAAMGGAAMGLFVGIGALGGVILGGVGLASLKGATGGVAENFQGAMGRVAENFQGAMGRVAENFQGAMGGLAENFQGAMGGLAENVMGFFGKKKKDD